MTSRDNEFLQAAEPPPIVAQNGAVRDAAELRKSIEAMRRRQRLAKASDGDALNSEAATGGGVGASAGRLAVGGSAESRKEAHHFVSSAAQRARPSRLAVDEKSGTEPARESAATKTDSPREKPAAKAEPLGQRATSTPISSRESRPAAASLAAASADEDATVAEVNALLNAVVFTSVDSVLQKFDTAAEAEEAFKEEEELVKTAMSLAKSYEVRRRIRAVSKTRLEVRREALKSLMTRVAENSIGVGSSSAAAKSASETPVTSSKTIRADSGNATARSQTEKLSAAAVKPTAAAPSAAKEVASASRTTSREQQNGGTDVKPVFLEDTTQTVTLQEADRLRVEFRVRRGVNRRDVRVLLPDGAPDAANQFRVSVIGETLKIEKRQALLSDGGVYTIEVSDSGRVERASFTVVAPQHGSLALQEPMQDVEVPEGSQLLLACRVNAMCERCSVSWDCPLRSFRYKSQVEAVGQDGSRRVTLIVRNIRKTDEGEYKLTVKHGEEECKSSAIVTVKAKSSSDATSDSVGVSGGSGRLRPARASAPSFVGSAEEEVASLQRSDEGEGDQSESRKEQSPLSKRSSQPYSLSYSGRRRQSDSAAQRESVTGSSRRSSVEESPGGSDDQPGAIRFYIASPVPSETPPETPTPSDRHRHSKGAGFCNTVEYSHRTHSNLHLNTTVPEETEALAPPRLIQKLPQQLCVDEHQELHLSFCAAGAKLVCQWLFKGKPLESRDWEFETSETADGTFCLVIEKASMECTGNFEALVTNADGSCLSNCLVTVHEAAPKVHAHFPSRTSIRAGETVELASRIGAASNVSLRLRKNGRSVEQVPGRLEVGLDEDGSCLLRIADARVADSGQYEVSFTNASGTACSGVSFVVEPRLVRPTIRRGLPPQLSLFEGDEMKLTAQVDGHALTATWTLNDARLSRRSGLSMKANDGTFELVIDRMRPQDVGVYRLVVSNSAGDASTVSEVEVKVPSPQPPAHSATEPQVSNDSDEGETSPVRLSFENSLSDLEFAEGSKEASLSCRLKQADDSAVALWFFNSQQLRRSSSCQEFDGRVATLNLPALTAEHSGLYVCGIKNSGTQAVTNCSLTVKPAPKLPVIAVELVDVRAQERDNVILQVELANLDRSCQVRWFQNERDLSLIEGVQRDFNGKVARLVIRDVYAKDSGNYEVVVTNEAGASRSSCNVLVDELPVPLPRLLGSLNDAVAAPGEPVTLTCRFDSIIGATRVDWFFRGVPLNVESSGCDVTQTGDTASLTVPEVTEADAGEYAVRVANKSGEVTSQCLVSLRQLASTEDFDKRKQIRSRLKTLHENEAKSFEEKKKAHVVTDAVALRARQAEEAKARQMKNFQEMAKTSAGGSQKDDVVKQRAERAQKEKEAEMRNFDELAKVPGVGVLQGGSERVKQLDQEAAARSKALQLQQYDQMAKHVDAQTTTVSNQPRRPQSKQQTPKSAMNAFKAMDKANNPEGKATPSYLAAGPRPAGRGVTRNPSQIKQMMLEWCRFATKDYKDKGVEVTNFSSSWADGLAFCALIHNFHPEAFNFNELSAANRRRNFEIAFEAAEKYADIAPLLDVEDMVRMKTPDWKCVFTYVQSFYRKFRAFSTTKTVSQSSEDSSTAGDQ